MTFEKFVEDRALLGEEIQLAQAAWRTATKEEHERCRQAVLLTKDKSGVNADGQSWLARASRNDFITAIDAL